MEYTLGLEYLWVLLVLVGLEGILAADNALVMAIMVKHLAPDQRKKALFYGLGGALIFRFASLFIISYLVGVWQVQAIGAAYLIFLALNHIVKKPHAADSDQGKDDQSSFWVTVLKVEVADIAFAVDSILAAVALAITLPVTPLPNIGGIDGGQFLVILLGGIIGLIIMRFAASWFVELLHHRPGLETTAFVIVGWVGVKLAVYTLAHPNVGIIYEKFPKTIEFKVIFWAVLILIAAVGWFLSKPVEDTWHHDE